jgi:hypothetical protein
MVKAMNATTRVAPNKTRRATKPFEAIEGFVFTPQAYLVNTIFLSEVDLTPDAVTTVTVSKQVPADFRSTLPAEMVQTDLVFDT